MHTFFLSHEMCSFRLITIMKQMRQLPHQNNLMRYKSVEIEAGFVSNSYNNLHD